MHRSPATSHALAAPAANSSIAADRTSNRNYGRAEICRRPSGFNGSLVTRGLSGAHRTWAERKSPRRDHRRGLWMSTSGRSLVEELVIGPEHQDHAIRILEL